MKHIAPVLLLLAPAMTPAAELKTADATRQLCQQMANNIIQGKASDAVLALRPYFPLDDDKLKELAAQLSDSVQMNQANIGKPLETEFIKTDTAGKNLLRHRLLVKFERSAMQLDCVFYRPRTAWQLESFKWNEDLSLLF